MCKNSKNALDFKPKFDSAGLVISARGQNGPSSCGIRSASRGRQWRLVERHYGIAPALAYQAKPAANERQG